MKNIIDVMNDVTNFILGEKEESLLELKRKKIGFQSEIKHVRKKRKYTRRKKK